MTDDTAFQRFVERYESGEIPWDDTLPPPEVVDLAATLLPGRALDLGCGYGRSTIYLAQQGWQVDGVDFVPQAIAEAQRRAQLAGVVAQVRFHVGSVAELGFLAGHYQLAVDVGCLHALPEAGQRAYSHELRRLLVPGSVYLLFARLAEEAQTEEGPRGMAQTAVHALFAQGFTLDRSAVGVTHVAEKSWRSGWFWFRRY